MKINPKLSIIIASFNTKDLLRQCLLSVYRFKKASDTWEVIVVDNASTDGTQEMIRKEFDKVHLLVQPVNVGFAAAINIGIRQSHKRYILLLNSDTEMKKDTITSSLRFLEERQEVGVVTCKLVLADGSMDPACHRGFPTPWAAFCYFSGLERFFPKSYLFAQYHQGFKDMTTPHEIDSPSGAFFMVRRTVIDSVGLLDEAFYMYGEDLDWSYRMKQAGWKIYYYPAVSVLHRKKQSGRDSDDPSLRRKTETYFYDTMKLFYKKHYQHRYGWLVANLVQLGIRLRVSFL